MNKEELKQKLKKYNYPVKEQFNILIVKLSPSLEVRIEFSENNSVIITDKLIGYNILTGIWSMSIRGSIIFNSLLLFFYALFFGYIRFDTDKSNLDLLAILFFTLGLGWIVLWTTYYHIKLENFKTLIKIWDC